MRLKIRANRTSTQLRDGLAKLNVTQCRKTVCSLRSFFQISKKFPAADVWLPPKNWSFPVDIPLEQYVPYYPLGSPKTLPENTSSGVGSVPWQHEIEHEVLEVGGSSLRNFKEPWFVDTAFYHKKSKTMLITDVVLHVSEDPPPVNAIDPEPLLVRGMEAPDQMLPNTREARSMGWGKTVLFGLLFQPLRWM